MWNSVWGGKWGADHCRKVIRICGGRLEKLVENDVVKYEKKRDFMEVYGESSHCSYYNEALKQIIKIK